MSVIIINSYRFAAPFSVWNARDDLNANLGAGKSNPNGRWTYGRTNANAVFSQLTVSTANGWGSTDQFGVPFINVSGFVLSSHTAQNADTVTLRWTAPSAMTVSIDVRITKTNTGGDGVRFFLTTGAGTVVNASGVIAGPSGVHTYLNPSYVVTPGQHLDFSVDRNGDFSSDNFNYDRVIITQVG